MRWSLLIVGVMWLATCGQKGPLYLPDQKSMVDAPRPASIESHEHRA